MVLIAQLSTASGGRAPLAQIADEVFVELARGIEAQGVGRKVVADMFGLALRSYQKKVQRLEENTARRERTLWMAVHDYLSEHGSATRRQLLSQFSHEEPNSVAAVLNDLVTSALVSRAGRGLATVYSLTDDEARNRLSAEQTAATRDSMVWVGVYRFANSTLDELSAALALDVADLQPALQRLVAQGRVKPHDVDGVVRYRAPTFLVPVGAEAGWEAAVFDHYQALVTAVAQKVGAGKIQSVHHDRIGGATLSFDVHDAHPYQQEVYELLARVRRDVNEVWDRVSAHNRENPIPENEKTKVTFYFGQSVQAPDEGDQ